MSIPDYPNVLIILRSITVVLQCLRFIIFSILPAPSQHVFDREDDERQQRAQMQVWNLFICSFNMYKHNDISLLCSSLLSENAFVYLKWLNYNFDIYLYITLREWYKLSSIQNIHFVYGKEEYFNNISKVIDL
jgi:hypothetical protein